MTTATGPVTGIELSVLIPVYNAGKTVGRTLASLARVAADSRPRVEVVVVDDGSTDDSPARVAEGRAAGVGFHWQVLTQPNRGPSAARNAALRAARGEWVLFLDADDELAADPVVLLAAAGGHSCLSCRVDYLRHGRPARRLGPRRVTARNWARVLTAGCPFAISSLVFRRGCVDHPFDEDVRFAEDWLFWMTNPRIFDAVHRLPDTTLSLIHIHGGNSSARYREWGRHRALAAGRCADLYRDRFGRTERNNLFLQAQIGRLQQGRGVPARTFFALPCHPVLYAKLWVYAAAAAVGLRATTYRAGG